MKKTFILLSILVLGLNTSFAQTQFDRIYFVDGREIEVKVIRNMDDVIEFTYPGEDIVNVVSKEKLTKIVFRSGREELISYGSNMDEEYELNRLKSVKLNSLNQPISRARKCLRGVKLVPVSVELAPSVKKMVEGNVDSFLDELTDIFVDHASISLRKFTKEDIPDCPVYAICKVVKVDHNDGEVYGILDIYDGKTGAVVYSKYLNGDGMKGEPSFNKRLKRSFLRSCSVLMF